MPLIAPYKQCDCGSKGFPLDLAAFLTLAVPCTAADCQLHDACKLLPPAAAPDPPPVPQAAGGHVAQEPAAPPAGQVGPVGVRRDPRRQGASLHSTALHLSSCHAEPSAPRGRSPQLQISIITMHGCTDSSPPGALPALHVCTGTPNMTITLHHWRNATLLVSTGKTALRSHTCVLLGACRASRACASSA